MSQRPSTLNPPLALVWVTSVHCSWSVSTIALATVDIGSACSTTSATSVLGPGCGGAGSSNPYGATRVVTPYAWLALPPMCFGYGSGMSPLSSKITTNLVPRRCTEGQGGIAKGVIPD